MLCHCFPCRLRNQHEHSDSRRKVYKTSGSLANQLRSAQSRTFDLAPHLLSPFAPNQKGLGHEPHLVFVPLSPLHRITLTPISSILTTDNTMRRIQIQNLAFNAPASLLRPNHLARPLFSKLWDTCQLAMLALEQRRIHLLWQVEGVGKRGERPQSQCAQMLNASAERFGRS